jgi:hypothetical protein
MEEESHEFTLSTITREKPLANRRNLYLAIGSTLAFSLYSVLILEPVGKCYRLEDSSNSLGLTFSYTLQIVEDFLNWGVKTNLNAMVYS